MNSEVKGAEGVKPCPFCGAKALVDTESGITTVGCFKDGCADAFFVEPDRSAAIAAWNRRPDPAKPTDGRHDVAINAAESLLSALSSPALTAGDGGGLASSRWPSLTVAEVNAMRSDANSAQGYRSAFYEVAEMLALPAMPVSPREAWEQHMRPALAAKLAPSPRADEGLREALRPFAAASETKVTLNGAVHIPRDDDVFPAGSIKWGDLRAARFALSASPTTEGANG